MMRNDHVANAYDHAWGQCIHFTRHILEKYSPDFEVLKQRFFIME